MVLNPYFSEGEVEMRAYFHYKDGVNAGKDRMLKDFLDAEQYYVRKTRLARSFFSIPIGVLRMLWEFPQNFVAVAWLMLLVLRRRSLKFRPLWVVGAILVEVFGQRGRPKSDCLGLGQFVFVRSDYRQLGYPGYVSLFERARDRGARLSFLSMLLGSVYLPVLGVTWLWRKLTVAVGLASRKSRSFWEQWVDGKF